MSEKYPRAWALVTHYVDETVVKGVYRSRLDAEDSARHVENVSGIVEYIAFPEHKSIVAAAVAAERERCAGIADAVAGAVRPKKRSLEDAFAQVASETAEQIAEKIREVPK